MTVKKPADATYTFPAGSKIVEAASHTYYLKTDVANNAFQLMHYDGTSNADVPVVDNVVGLSFDYYGDAQPPIVRKPLADPTPPGTTYGPKPSAVALPNAANPTAGPFVAGENCIFSNDGSPIPAPKLATLGGGTQALVKFTAADFTDGPFCPNATNANRWDADLLRIRKVGVTLRVQTAVSALRGPASVLFTRGGTSKGGVKWVPDQELHFEIAPRNLNLGR
jgi:hypothetical protein